MTEITIRPIAKHDHIEWAQLYQGYAEFYKVNQTAEMRDTVWGWLLDPEHTTQGFVAILDEKLVGLTHYRPFSRPLSASTGGYLDDLFVSPAARGTGAAAALIEAVRSEGLRQGWSVIRWITADDNARARSLYDRVATQTKWVTYDIKI